MQPLEPLELPLHGCLLLEASAGTGKTYTLALLFLRLLLEQGLAVDQILVVTFTRAATSELRDRIRIRIREALRILEQGTSKDPLLQALLDRVEPELARQRLADALVRMDAFTAAAKEFGGQTGTDTPAFVAIHQSPEHMKKLLGLGTCKNRTLSQVERVNAAQTKPGLHRFGLTVSPHKDGDIVITSYSIHYTKLYEIGIGRGGKQVLHPAELTLDCSGIIDPVGAKRQTVA